MKIPIALTSCTVATTLLLTSCESPTGTGALAGAGLGAAIGAATSGGDTRRNVRQGALIGAGAGALIGHLVGRSNRGYYEGSRLPVARPVGRGLVESPYYPHNVIDVGGIPPGAVVEDPSTGRRFIRP